MAVALYRIDDRLIHGQVIVGWGQPLSLSFIVLVDDAVAASDWEQDLYRAGVPPEMEVTFESVASAVSKMASYESRADKGIVLTGDIDTMLRLVEATAHAIHHVNLGGIHHRAGRAPRLRYVFLAPDEEAALRTLSDAGVVVCAQDVPAATPVPLTAVLAGSGA